ncbi:hypothetical protein AB0H88_04915 [Nonomuraea sp. NPDC050680]|uniref:hypothetical protein n=1 Tax=Nonomuraea sp. NPDC050680 TaxID=3154630 RepID=UPI0033C52515
MSLFSKRELEYDVLPPWRPRGVEIRGRATTVGDAIVIHPTRVTSWAMDIHPAEREPGGISSALRQISGFFLPEG